MVVNEEIQTRMREAALSAVDGLKGHEEKAKFIGQWIITNKSSAGYKNLAKTLVNIAEGTIDIPS